MALTAKTKPQPKTKPPPRARSAQPARAAKTPAPAALHGPETYRVLLRYVAAPATPRRVVELAMSLADRAFYPDVQRWRYVVANRRRITKATRDTLGEDLAQWLGTLCELDRPALDVHLKAMARAALVEVVIPFQREALGWAARLFPWENILSLLTRNLRDDAAPFTVVRQLQVVGDADAAPVALVPTKLLLVRSAPGAVADLYDIAHEVQMVQSSLQTHLLGSPEPVLDPDRLTLQAQVKAHAPSVIHLACVDPQALMQHGLQDVDNDHHDGVVLRAAERGFDAVNPGDAARLVNAAATKPLLVSYSSCFGAQRLGALTVAGGAQHCIAFFDSVTDADVMLFFSSFYGEWAREWDIAAAFQKARQICAEQGAPQSAGVVLWSRRSLLMAPGRAAATSRSAPEATVRLATAKDLRLTVDLNTDRSSGGLRTERTSLNFSLLHNDRTPFRTFFIEKPWPGPLPPLQVEVALDVGGDLCRSRFSVELSEEAKPTELKDRIRLPLVAGMLRQCTESLRTNIYVRVSCGDRLIRESSERVTVLPADEWRDDGEDHRWLPSFVLPRDPVVLKVISAAQRYLRTLLDDCTAGFDGYQQLPAGASAAQAAAVVDPQVQAIWAALQHDLPVNYINPPPSYTSQSQRLRSPSEVFRGQAATCIDLALLFASCLEFVGIYPSLFLIQGHAFPGYWRSDEAWLRMKQFKFDAATPALTQAQTEPLATPDASVGSAEMNASAPLPGGQSESWMFDGVGNLVELLRYVQEGTLVPFESTFVAAQKGFFAAQEEGSARLHPNTFDCMVDIQSARGANVTPLPLFDKFS